MKTFLLQIRSVGFGIFSLVFFPLVLASSTASAQSLCYGIHIPSPFAKMRTEADIKTLKVLAFNVENLYTWTGKAEWTADFKQKKFPGGEEPKPERDIEWIREILLKRDADFMILTEVENKLALQTLAKNGLQGRYRPLLIEGNDARGIDIGFMIKADLPWEARIKTNKDIRFKDPVSGEAGLLFSRDLPVLEVYRKDKPNEILFVIIGNHAKSKRDRDGDPESTRWRTAQYAEAAKIIQSYQSRGIGILFGGDFNTDVKKGPEVEPVRQILQSSFDVAKIATPVAERTTHTFHPRKGAAEFAQMDDIMVSPNLAQFVLSAEVVRYLNLQGQVMPFAKTFDQRGKQPSDHLPVEIVIDAQVLLRR